MAPRGKLLNLSAAVVLVTSQGCIKAPPIAVVDTRTALEVQASGEYPELEFEAADSALEPGPSPMSGKEIVSQSGLAAAGHDLDLFAATLSDAQFIDSMLLLGCLGEGEDGLLKYTPERCGEEVQVSELLSTASRTNLHRRQIWEYLASKRPDRSTASARDAWRSVHLEQVRCGAWIEKDGRWSKKAC
jgi:hypothetical protein